MGHQRPGLNPRETFSDFNPSPTLLLQADVLSHIQTSTIMTASAKIFTPGNSQAIRLHKVFRLDADEVWISKASNGGLNSQPKPKQDDLEAFFEQLRCVPAGLWPGKSGLRLSQQNKMRECLSRQAHPIPALVEPRAIAH